MIEEALDWLAANGLQTATAILASLKVAQEIAKITPTQKDDKFIEKYIRKPVEWIGNIGLPNIVVYSKKRKK